MGGRGGFSQAAVEPTGILRIGSCGIISSAQAVYSKCDVDINCDSRFSTEADCIASCKDAKKKDNRKENKAACGTSAPICEEGCVLKKKPDDDNQEEEELAAGNEGACLHCVCEKGERHKTIIPSEQQLELSLELLSRRRRHFCHEFRKHFATQYTIISTVLLHHHQGGPIFCTEF